MKSLAEFIGVEEGQEFQFGANFDLTRYRIKHCCLEQYDVNKKDWERSNIPLNAVIYHLEKAKMIILNPYSPSTIEAAKHDSYRFKYVARDANGYIYLYMKKPRWEGDRGHFYYGVFIRIKSTEYPEVKPGQCVELREIVGCEG